MKTKNIVALLVFGSFCVWANGLLAGVIPEVGLDDTKAGVQVTFDVSPFKNPIDWGKRTGGAGDALYSGGRGTHFDGQYHRYGPTFKGLVAVVGMSTNEDWVMSMKIEIVTNAPGSKTIFETSAASGGDMVKLITTAVANEFQLQGRSGGSLYGAITNFTMTSAVEHTLTLHFKVANSKLDFYVDDALVASDFEGRANANANTGPPYYDINFIQVDDSNSNIGVYTYDDVLIGPLAPPAPVIPEVGLDDTKAGVQVTFDVSPFKTPIDWGKRTGGAGDALYSGGRGTHFDGQYHRYGPTFKGLVAVVGMSTNEDWVMSMKIEIVTNAPGSKTIFETSAASGGDMVKLITTAVANEFTLQGRSGGATYGTIATFTMTSAVEHTLTLHFKVANSLLDFYVDDALVASDFEGRANANANTGPPYYDINFIQVDDSNSNIGVYTYDDVLIGPLALPAPLVGTVIIIH